MKKLISLALCLALVFSTLTTAFASFDRNDLNGYPVVIVPGFMNAQMHIENEDGTTEKAWLGGFDEALKQAGLSSGKLIADGVSYGLGKENDLAATLAPIVNSVIEKLACNPDGTSKYNVVTDVPPTAEASRWSNLRDEDLTLQDYIDDIISTDDIYICFTDFRMDPADNAKILDQLIDDIIATTGCKKVNLLAQSYGGQVTGAYLSIYAEKAGEKINSAVLMCPALGGAGVATDFLTGNLDIDEQELVRFVAYAINLEYDLDKLLASQPLGFLDDLAKQVLPTFTEVARSWLSIWDFLPYESYKDKHRASVKHLFDDTVDGMYEDYIRPQENGSRWNCDYVRLTGPLGGLEVTGEEFSFNASRFTQEELTAKAHNYELESCGDTVFCLDYRQNGIGSNSCGPQLNKRYEMPAAFTFDFSMMPFSADGE